MKKAMMMLAAVAASMVLPVQADGVNAFSYIQKGLVACYDGIENAGVGVHDPNATTWVDLTGNGNDGTVTTGITWGDAGWVSVGSVPRPVTLGTGIAAVTGSETFTMEFTGTRATTGRGILFGQYDVDYSVNFEFAADGTGTTANALRLHFLNGLAGGTLNQYTTRETLSYANGDSATLALTTAPKERGLWRDGVRGTFSNTTLSTNEIVNRVTDCPSAIGGDFRGGNGIPFIGTCNAFRLYDRVLTADELSINTAVDAVRFRGADPATLRLPPGWSFDTQTNLVRTVTVSALGGMVQVDGGAAVATFTSNIVQDASVTMLTFTAAAAAGYEFLGWGGDTDAITEQNGLEVTVDCSEPCAIYAVFRSNTPPAVSTADYDYVTNGLVVWYDGVDNAGVGTHDATTSTWTDLSGNGRDATLNSIATWTDNGWENGTTGYPVSLPAAANAAVASTIATRTFTLEFTACPSRTTSRENYFGSYNTGGLGIEHNSSAKSIGQIRLYYNGNPNYDTDVTQAAGESAVFSLVSGASNQRLYKNGALALEGATTVGATRLSANATYYIGNDASRPSNAFRGKFHSFRLYDRLLTEEEVVRNAAADRARLLEAGATVWTNATGGAWVDNGSWDYGVPNVRTPASLTKSGGTKTVVMATAVPAITNLTVSNGSGATQVRVAYGGRLPVENAAISIGRGGELKVEADGRVDYDGANAPFSQTDTTISVADGGKLTVDGGTVNLNDFKGRLIVSGSGTDTGLVSIASGKLNIVTDHTYNSLQCLTGGRLEMTGGRFLLKQSVEFVDAVLKLVDGGAVEMSGDAQLDYEDMSLTLGSGKVHLRDNARMGVKVFWNGTTDKTQYGRLRVQPTSGQTAEVTVDDNSTIELDALKPMVYISNNIKNGRAIVNWNSPQTLHGENTFAVGYANGYAELNITAGQMVGGAYGFRVAQPTGTGSAGACVTGVVNIAGGSILTKSPWMPADSVHGLIVGAGTVVNLSDPGFFRGTINVSGGALTNGVQYLGVGIGVAEGDIVQTGGEVRHQPATHQMIVGAFGGEGRYIMSNGVATAKSDVFVGGVTTNLMYHKPINLYTVCPVTNHCAKGLLRVAGGSFATEGTLWLSQDGEGVLEIGPAGAVTAANMTLTNTPAALTGSTDLAAKVRFTFGPQGVGTLTATGALTIGPGATLEVDSTALEKDGRYPLIACGTCEGDFASVSVTGIGVVEKGVVNGQSGYWLTRATGTMVILR